MSKWSVWGLACWGLMSAATSAQAGKLTAKPIDLGEIAASSDVLVSIPVTNTGSSAVTVTEIRPVGSHDRATIASKTIAPGATANVEAHLYLALDNGGFRRQLAVFTDQDKSADLELVISGYAWAPFTDPLPSLDIGAVDFMQPLKPVRWELPKNTESKLKIVGTPLGLEHFDVRILDDGRVLELTPKASMPRSPITGRAVVRVADVDGTLYDVSVLMSGNAFDRIAPNSDTLNLGLFEMDKAPQGQIVVITDRTGKPLEITKIERSDSVSAARIRECVKKDKACKMIQFDMAKQGRTGNVFESLTIHAKGQESPIIVRLSGLRIAPGTKIMDLQKPADAKDSGRESATVSNVPLIEQMRKASEPPAPPAVHEAEPGDGPLLKWQVETEKQAYGYVVFRAEAENGPFLRVSRPMIKRVSPDSTGASYAWRDNTAQAGKTYWYFVTTVYADGHRSRLSPVIKKIVAAR